MDQALVRADFIGVVKVEHVYAPRTDGDPIRLELSVEDVWFQRTPVGQRIVTSVSGDAWGDFRLQLVEKNRLVVMMSGGPWEHSPFTVMNNSLYVIQRDSTLTCSSGNPLFGFSVSGFYCSIQAYMPAPPLTLGELRQATIRARSLAAARLPTLEQRLTQLQRPIEEAPTPASGIDRTVIENEVYR